MWNAPFARAAACLCILALLPVGMRAQGGGTLINGSIRDTSGAMVPNATIVLKNTSNGATHSTKTGNDGLYSFQQLGTGNYELQVSLAGFRDYTQKGIKLNIDDKLRVDVTLEIGSAQQTIEVEANASQLNFENAEVKGGISPDTVGELPLAVAGGVRSVATFVTLLPGSTSPTGDVLSAHVNGGVQYSGEAILNGGSLVNPSGGQGMWSAAFDFAQSPDMVSEVKILQANYEPQYGSTGGAVIIMETKSGTNQYHGSAFEFFRNTALNARQFDVDLKPKDIENDFGVTFGGPLKIPLPGLRRNRAFFFFNYEGFRQVGAPSRPTYSIPSTLERQGDFSDWTDANGSLIPIYDPLTSQTLPDGTVTRQQFMGCDGQHPNVICSTRFDPTALGFFKYLPQPTSGGPLNNFVPQGNGSNWNGKTNLYSGRLDEYIGDKDHITATVFRRDLPTSTQPQLPPEISTDMDTYKYTWSNHLNWDHTFGPNLINHFAGNYNHDYYQAGGHNAGFADVLPQIAGAVSHHYPPQMNFGSGFISYGSGVGSGPDNKWPAPAFVFSDLLTWVKGHHTLKFGAEYRNQRNSNEVSAGEAGILGFGSLETGLRDVNSGNPLASFLLGQVDSGNISSRPYGLWSARWSSYIAHVGDTWKATSKLSVNLGLRWDMHPPTVEQHDVFSFLDPSAANPSAGGLPGALTFAGTRWGNFSYGKRYPEELFKTGFAPRLGIAYAANEKTVIRAGYGIFYDAGYYPGWMGGIANDGFNLNSYSFGSPDGGLTPAFLTAQGFPDTWPKPPFIDPGFLNGQNGPIFRPKDANRLPYTQQWNFGVEREITKDLSFTASYVGTKGNRLTSSMLPMNALNPSLLKQYGNQLFDTFGPADTVVDGVKAPYADWVNQMAGCGATVAQALLQFPQYCGGLTGIDEKAGNSNYHSLQLKVEKRFSKGLWVLGSYTWAKLLTDTDSNQPGGSPISPFERQRNKSLAQTDIPHTLVVSFVYDTPFGRGRRWVNQNRVADFVIGGWQLSSIIRYSTGAPMTITSSKCNVPGAFRASCLPGILSGQNPWAQEGSVNPDLPLLNVNAFEGADSFNNYWGAGSRVTTLRTPNFFNEDLTIQKSFHMTEKVEFQIRGDFFNVYNNHTLTGFDTDVASPSFGMWNGGVTNPRYLQIGGKIKF